VTDMDEETTTIEVLDSNDGILAYFDINTGCV
jgi:hypothetical protein